MVNQIYFSSFSALFPGMMFKRSHFLLCMGDSSTQNKVSEIASSYISASENNESGKQDWSVKTNVCGSLINEVFFLCMCEKAIEGASGLTELGILPQIA